jgi:2-keto-4-pentenoate hydratase/2-oxohepta-3-ene-1,7-dioic acid hydratase in catechol pathway
MRLAVIETDDGRRLAEVDGASVCELGFDADVAGLLRDGVDPSTLARGATRALESTTLEAPLHPGKIVAIGLNYHRHASESGVEAPTSPLIFAKFPSSVTGPTDEIVIDRDVTQSVDWEAELGVVVGSAMRNVPAERVLEHVFGYTVVNDVTARDAQSGDGQWIRGKSMDTFCPLGPVVVTRDEIPDPQALRVWAAVNGELMQDASTADMIFPVAELLAYCSRNFTLKPGDLVITGTPWGVGVVRDPPLSLQAGDLLETGVDGIGSLANPVVEASGAPTFSSPQRA